MRIHTGEKPFKCTFDELICNAAFKTFGQLKDHLCVHSKIKKFSCEICQKSFSRKWTLKQHGNVHRTNKNLQKFGNFQEKTKITFFSSVYNDSSPLFNINYIDSGNDYMCMSIDKAKLYSVGIDDDRTVTVESLIDSYVNLL